MTVEDFKDGRGEGARDIRRIEFKLADKRAALVDLGRHLGMFVDQHELTGKDGGPIETAALTPEERATAAIRMVDETFAAVMGRGGQC